MHGQRGFVKQPLESQNDARPASLGGDVDYTTSIDIFFLRKGTDTRHSVVNM